MFDLSEYTHFHCSLVRDCCKACSIVQLDLVSAFFLFIIIFLFPFVYSLFASTSLIERERVMGGWESDGDDLSSIFHNYKRNTSFCLHYIVENVSLNLWHWTKLKYNFGIIVFLMRALTHSLLSARGWEEENDNKGEERDKKSRKLNWNNFPFATHILFRFPCPCSFRWYVWKCKNDSSEMTVNLSLNAKWCLIISMLHESNIDSNFLLYFVIHTKEHSQKKLNERILFFL